MMPPPVLFACTILIGWPLLKLAATLWSRPIWRKLRDISAEIKTDKNYGDAERSLVGFYMRAAKGEPLQLLPIPTFAGGIAFSIHRVLKIKEGEIRSFDISIEGLKRHISKLEFRNAKLDLDCAPSSD